MRTFDVIVVGVGAMGASTCFQLANRKRRVLGVEQFDIPHARGSSHGYSRMIRMAYYEHPDYVPLLQRSLELWRELEQLTGRTLLHLVGGLYMGPPGGILMTGSRLAAQQHKLPYNEFSHKELRRDWPQFLLPDGWGGIFEEQAGFLLPENVICSYAEQAMSNGAELHGREAVKEWHASDHGVVVRTDRDEYEAGQLVFTGGAWSGKLLRDLNMPLSVTHQVLGWVWPRKPELFQLGCFPVWGIDSQDGGIYYGFPMIKDIPGFKLAHHLPGKQVDPDTEREPQFGEETDFLSAIRKYLPDADGPLLALRTCMYTNTPDHNFIIDRHPQHPQVQIACGFSGHGFKFASVVGEIIADRITQSTTLHAADFLRLDRPTLQRGNP